MKIGIVGAGWAGLAAAVTAAQAGHAVSVFETARIPGGRARSLSIIGSEGSPISVDNGQHILIGAYTETLRLMRMVGVDPEAALQRLPLTVQFADQGPRGGLRLPNLPPPWDVLSGILRHPSWPWGERLRLLRAAVGWQLAGFRCDEHLSVAELCASLGPQVQAELIEPLCVSALNTPAHRASAAVFLRVLHDALFTVRGGSQLLLPRMDLGSLFPQAARQWLTQHRADLSLGSRVQSLIAQGQGYALDGEPFDAVLLACSNQEAARLVVPLAPSWSEVANGLHFEAITTVYAHDPAARLSAPMLALRSGAQTPAQFVFDRGQLGGPPGLLAFVVSASVGERDTVQAQVLAQAHQQLGLGDTLRVLQTVVEKRATFACTPGLLRPAARIAPRLWACGDYVAGPYPATLEGAVRSAQQAVQMMVAQSG
jgi:squalene-associated FAD-dependent desaturase